jgi:hypothetical protein
MNNTLEQQEKELQIKLKKLEVREKTHLLGAGLKQKSQEEKDRISIEKLQVLQYLITASMVDESKSILGSDSIHKPVFCEEELWILKGKILELVKKL